MSSECIFEFDHPNKIYFSGETINGRVKLHTTKAKQVKSAYLLFQGHAKVRWTSVSEPHYSNGYIRTNQEHSGDEIFIKERINIFTEGRLPAGLHTYAFSIPLPTKCRTSCTEKYGEIIYVMSMIIERDLTYNNVFSQPLTVIKPLDLNSNPDYLLPIEGEDVKYVCCFPCSSGPILTTLTIPYGGWVPGQDIPFTLDVNNQSRFYDVQGIKIRFQQLYQFTVDTPIKETRTHENALATKETRERVILRKSKREIQGKIHIPPVPPTLDTGIINITYRVGIQLHIGEFHVDAEVWVPITIGTIPLTQSVLPASVMGGDVAADLPPSYDLCTPATFEEPTNISAKFKDNDRDDYNTFVNWLPKYPVYKQFSTTDDELTNQLCWSPNMTATQHTNLFISEVEATAPELYVPANTEESELLKNVAQLDSTYNPNFTTTVAQCPPYDRSYYSTDLASDVSEHQIEIINIPEQDQASEAAGVMPNNEVGREVTELPKEHESNTNESTENSTVTTPEVTELPKEQASNTNESNESTENNSVTTNQTNEETSSEDNNQD